MSSGQVEPTQGKFKHCFVVVLVVYVFNIIAISVLLRNWQLANELFMKKYVLEEMHNGRYLSSSFASTSQLGNHMFELVSLLGISRSLNRSLIFWEEDSNYQRMLSKTRAIFPGLIDKYKVVRAKVPYLMKSPKFPDSGHTFESPERLQTFNDTLLHLSGKYYQSWKYFPDMRREVLSFLRPPRKFFGLPESNSASEIICIHTRRGDFLKERRFSSDQNFIRRAVEFIDSQNSTHHPETTIVLFGDDLEFMKSIFPNTTHHYISQNIPSDDLLYASQHCDTVFISAPVSTFGWWMGYLSKGDRVFYTDVRTTNDAIYKSGWMKPENFYLPHWTPLKFDLRTSTVSRTTYY